MNDCQRPPIGFIVEGTGEYHCYPSLVARITGNGACHIPVVNARGSGNIIEHLPEHLDDLAKTRAPKRVIITLDLRDPMRAKRFQDCVMLKQHVEEVAAKWAVSRVERPEFSTKLPVEISTVIQVRCLETWLIADMESLCTGGYLRREGLPVFSDLDKECGNPMSFIEKHEAARNVFNHKHPPTVKRIASTLDVDVMATSSRSFRKFRKQVTLFFGLWLEETGLT